MIAAPRLAAACLLAALAAEDEALEPGVWARREAPDDWLVVEEGRYQFQSRLPRADTERLAEHVHAMGSLYDALVDGRSSERRVAVKLFDHGPAFFDYGGVRGVVAYTDLRVPEIAAYDEGVVLGERHVPTPARVSAASTVFTAEERAAIDALLERVGDVYLHDVGESLAHEAWHVHVDAATGNAPIPLWLDEGLADVLAVAHPQTDASAFDPSRTNPERLRRLHRAVVERATIPLRDLVQLDARGFDRDRELSYAMAWGLVHFLLHHHDAERRAIPSAILDDVRLRRSPDEAVARAFADVDFETLEREFAVWVRRLPFDDPLDELARRFGDRLRVADLTAPDHWKDAYAWFVSRR